MSRCQDCQIGPERALESLVTPTKTVERFRRQLCNGISRRLHIVALTNVKAGELDFGFVQLCRLAEVPGTHARGVFAGLGTVEAWF